MPILFRLSQPATPRLRSSARVRELFENVHHDGSAQAVLAAARTFLRILGTAPEPRAGVGCDRPGVHGRVLRNQRVFPAPIFNGFGERGARSEELIAVGVGHRLHLGRSEEPGFLRERIDDGHRLHMAVGSNSGPAMIDSWG